MLILVFINPVQAKEIETIETQNIYTTKLESPWEFRLAIPIWLAGVSGEVGVHGRTSDIDVGVGTILRKLNFTASFSVEARKGRFGVYGDFLYLSDQTGVTRNRLISRIDLRVDEYLTDFDLNWRFLSNPRGWLDLLAGFRYINLYNRLGLDAGEGAIQAASERLVNVASDQIKRLLEKELGDALHLRNPPLPVAPLAAELEQKLLKQIQKARKDPELAAAVESGDQARIDQAKRKVERKIAKILSKNLNRSFSLSEDWIDPYIGLRARYNLAEAFYLTAKADVGGFSVGSRLSSQVYGAIGCQITRNFYSEAGYRFLYVDYRNGGFTYKISTSGAEITLGLLF